MATSKDGAGTKLTGHLELLHPSKYVKAADLRGKDVTVVIDYLTRENLIMAGGKRDQKIAISLRSVGGKSLDKKLIVGKTVLRMIGGAIGDRHVERWSGCRITLYPTTCRGADGSTVECIRVRVRTAQTQEEPPAEMTAPVDPKDFMDEVGDEDAGKNGGDK